MQQYISLLRMEFLLQILHWPDLSQNRADDGASSEDWDERLRKQWLAISSSASSKMNSLNVAVHHTDVYQEVEQW